jgi:hypothetical protein
MRSGVALLVLFCGCLAPAAPRPDDMSAAAHRREAARERAEAGERLSAHHEGVAAIDPRVPGGLAGVLPAEEARPGGLVQRRGTPDLWAAEAHLEHARLHEEAAAALERFEAAECAGVPAELRASCPLLAGAGAIVDIAGGVEIRFHAGAPVDEVVARMRCHLAFARASGFEAGTSCPLYVKGLAIERIAPRIVRITGDAATAAAVRERARALAPGVGVRALPR